MVWPLLIRRNGTSTTPDVNVILLLLLLVRSLNVLLTPESYSGADGTTTSSLVCEGGAVELLVGLNFDPRNCDYESVRNKAT